MDLFCCCFRSSIEQLVFPRLLNRNTRTYLEGCQFLCQAQIHRRQHCLLKRKTDKDVNRVTIPLLHYCLRIVNLVLEISIFSCFYTLEYGGIAFYYCSLSCNEKSCN